MIGLSGGRSRDAALAILIVWSLAPVIAPAQEPSSPEPPERRFRWETPALFLGGAAAAFAAHESGHLVANYALGNEPTYQRVRYMGAIPFFAIDPGIHCQGDRCTRRNGERFGPGKRGLFLIETAGIQVQQYTDELILTQNPRLREADAPFRTGMLAFNTLTSIAYVLSNMAGTEPPNGDLRGVYRDVGAPRNAMNAIVLGVAGLDIARYWFPDARWLAWLSRAGKVATTGIVFTL